MNLYVDEFVEYLTKERSMAKNSLDAYRRDVSEFMNYITSHGKEDITTVTRLDVEEYISDLENCGRASSTVNRKMAALRAFIVYLSRMHVIPGDLMESVRTPKREKKDIEYLDVKEVEAILSVPDNTLKGIRDKAILELLYATGIRVSEITEMKIEDVNFRSGYIVCNGRTDKARMIPIGYLCSSALRDYVFNARPQMTNGGGRGLRSKEGEANVSGEDMLFVNYYGEKLTRQGLWKIIKQYAEKAGISKKLTPQIIRNSFAVHMAQNGTDIKSLQALMGHEDLTTTQAYIGTAKNNALKSVYEKAHPRA